MSHNQSRGERTESTQYRKTGRSGNNQQRSNSGNAAAGFKGTGGGGGGGGASAAPTNQSRSFKKYNNNNSNAQGAQGRGSGNFVNVNPINQNVAHNIQNGSHLQQQTIRGESGISGTTAPIKHVDVPAPKTTNTVPMAPPSGVPMASSEISTPTTPAKAPGGSPRPITLQFGTMSPNVVNGMHIPARTSSAPPNIDEQKRDQARHQASGSFHNPPTSSIPKQPFPKPEVGPERHSTAVESHSISQSKADEQVSAMHASPQVPKPSLKPQPRMPVPVPFHQQQQVPLQYSGPPQMQSQVTVPMHIPVPLPQQPMFVPHPHPMHPPGLIHQGQSFNFSPPLPPQISPHPGNIAMNMSPQFHQQQAGKFAPRKVKITHPETHEELRFDGSPGPRPNPNMPPQSQPVPSFQHPQVNYYPNSFPTPGSLPVGSTQANSHILPQRPHSKVTVKFSGTSNKEREATSSTSAPISEKVDSSILKTPESVVINQPEKAVDHSTIDDKVGGLPMPSSTSQPSQLERVEAKSTPPTVVTEVVKSDKESVSTATEGIVGEPSISTTAESRQVEPKISPEVQGIQSEGIDNVAASVPTVNKVSGPSSSITGDAEISTLNPSVSKAGDIDLEDASLSRSAISNLDPAPIFVSNEDNLRHDVEVGELKSSTSGVQDKLSLEADVMKDSAPKGGKKKLKDIIKRADAAGATSDLYMAYKGPDEKNEIITSVVSKENISSESVNQIHNNDTQDDAIPNEKDQNKVEPDDWEDAADNSTEPSQQGNQVDGGFKNDADGEAMMIKKYSRDFLSKFQERCTDLPEGFEITSDTQALMASNANVSRESNPSSGRAIDKMGGTRPDRRANIMVDEDKWNKVPGPFVSERDIGAAGNMMGYRPGPGGNSGVVRGGPRAQMHGQYPSLLPGGMQLPSPHGALQRNNADSDRWQRGNNFQKGLMPYPQMPQTPPPIIHRSENKYLIGKVADEEQAKQRQLKSILNKLTPQNFEKLFEQVKQVNIDNDVTLTGVISQIFDKALMEPTFCEMYADFCHHLAAELPDLSVGDEKITFKRLLLNKCQEEFERGEREQEEANKAEEEGEVKQSEEERESKRLQARRRMLGNIRLIGELYKKRMLTERIMHECIKKLLGGPVQIPDEEDLEALCKLMSTIGEMIDHPKAKEHMDVYFDMMAKLSTNMKLSSRVRFMLLDAIDLRKNKWQQRRKVEGPKKIDEVHRDAAQERQAQASRLARGPSFGNPVRRGQPMDYGPRGGSTGFSSPGSLMGGPRPISHNRSFGGQDARFEDRHPMDNRMLSVPLPARSDDSITLGPQGGLGRGMSYRGQPSAPSMPLSDRPSSAEARKMGTGLNSSSTMPDRSAYAREDLMPRSTQERFPSQSIYDRTSTQDPKLNYRNNDGRIADLSLERTKPTSPARGDAGSSSQTFPEEQLSNMSLAAIREFYSAKDESEVILCIKELDCPSYYPSMISLWVIDSFERKDLERGLLSKLLVNLAKSGDQTISEHQLISGFESVLSTLEDTVTDAPKAPKFLGHLFAHVISENIISLSEIGRLIYEGGDEQGRLVEIGLAAEVLQTIFETILNDKGHSVLAEIRAGANLQLDNFRPPGSNKPWTLG